MKHLLGAPHFGRLLAIPTNITLAGKACQGENHMLIRSIHRLRKCKDILDWPWQILEFQLKMTNTQLTTSQNYLRL